MPLRPSGFYPENAIDLRLKTNVTAIDAQAREVGLADGKKITYDRLLLATGAEPVRLSIPGADQDHVHALRSLSDCRAIIDRAKTARRAVVLGASFIGLEVAASLRARNLEVHVVAPEKRPMERILGPQMGDFVHSLHTAQGVNFHLEDVVIAINGNRVKLRSGGELEADLVVVGVGVRPQAELAAKAGHGRPRRCRQRLPRMSVPASSRLATSPAGLILQRRAFASSTGLSPSVEAKRPRSICSASGRSLPPFRSSGANITMWRSTMSVTPKNGMS